MSVDIKNQHIIRSIRFKAQMLINFQNFLISVNRPQRENNLNTVDKVFLIKLINVNIFVSE